MASGSLRTKFWFKCIFALCGTTLLAQASTIDASVESEEISPLHYSIQGGPTASTAWGLGFALGADFINITPEATGFYEGGFLPHVELGAQAFSGTAPLFHFSFGAQFYSNFNKSNSFGLRNALIHGYREVLRNNPVFLEGNFLGLIPFYVSGFHWRLPWGTIDLQWTPIELLRATRDLLNFASSLVQGAIQSDWPRHIWIGRTRAGILYLGNDGMTRSQSGVGFTYGLETEYRFKASQMVQLGTRLGIEGGLANVRDSSNSLTSGWSIFGFQSHVFVLIQF